MKKIQVGGHIKSGKIRKFAMVDDIDFERINKWRWSACLMRKAKWCYAVTFVKGKPIYMARLITNAPKGKVVDHINGNTLDNRRCNLRVVTTRENSGNTYKHRANPVALGTNLRSWGKYEARITIDGKRKYLGMFKTQIEAHRAFLQASK